MNSDHRWAAAIPSRDTPSCSWPWACIGGVYTVALAISPSRQADAAIASGRADDVAEAQETLRAELLQLPRPQRRGHRAQGPTLYRRRARPPWTVQVSSGRMPLANPSAQAPQQALRRPGSTRTPVRQLGAYIQSLVAAAPTVPSCRAESTAAKGDKSKGGELFRANCIQCPQDVRRLRRRPEPQGQVRTAAPRGH
ncbi:hypothetical protein GCM10018952_33770 [Streptosporangium vulgare]